MKVLVVLLSFLALTLSAPISAQFDDGIVDFDETQSSIAKADESVHDLTSDEDTSTNIFKTATNLNNHTWTCEEHIPCYVALKNCFENCASGLMIIPTGQKQTEFDVYMSGSEIDKESFLAVEYKSDHAEHTFRCIPARKSVQDEILKNPNEIRFISGRETSHSISCKFTAHVTHNFNNTNGQYNIQLGKFEGDTWKVTDSKRVLQQQSFIGGRFEKFDNDKEAVEIVQKAEKKIMEDLLASGTTEAQGTDSLISQFEEEFNTLMKKKVDAEEKKKTEAEEKKKAEAEEKKKTEAEEKKKTEAEEKKKTEAEEKKKTEAEEKKKTEAEEKKKTEAEEKKKTEAEKKKKAEVEEKEKAETDDEEKAETDEKKETEEKKNSNDDDEEKDEADSHEKKKTEKKTSEAKTKSSKNESEELNEDDADVEKKGNKKVINNKKASKDKVFEEKEDSNEPKMRSSDDDEDDEEEGNNDEYDEDSNKAQVRTEGKSKSKDRELFDSLMKSSVKKEDRVFMAPDSSSLSSILSACMIALLVLMF